MYSGNTVFMASEARLTSAEVPFSLAVLSDSVRRAAQQCDSLRVPWPENHVTL